MRDPTGVFSARPAESTLSIATVDPTEKGSIKCRVTYDGKDPPFARFRFFGGTQEVLVFGRSYILKTTLREHSTLYLRKRSGPTERGLILGKNLVHARRVIGVSITWPFLIVYALKEWRCRG